MPKRKQEITPKTVDQIERAHCLFDDALTGPLKSYVDFEDEMSFNCMVAQRDALCWALGHSEETGLAKVLAELEILVDKLGLELKVNPEVN